jgi:hypothetical protein
MPADAASVGKVRCHVWSLGKELTLGVRRDYFVGAFRAAVLARQNPFGIRSHSPSLRIPTIRRISGDP